MKVIFLDIDGVLNGGHLFYGDQEHALDRAAIKRLNYLAARTGAVAVLTSTWRLLYPWPQCREILCDYGLSVDVVGETRNLWSLGQALVASRRLEIEEWLKRNPVESFVILDDYEVFPGFERCFVRTHELTGLTDADVARAIAILNAAPLNASP